MRVEKKCASSATPGVQGQRRMIAHSSASMALPRAVTLPPLLALRTVPPLPSQARSAIVWGEAHVARLAARTAAEAVSHGVTVAVIDAALAFEVTAIAACAQARRVPPERFLRHIFIARAFTCYQVATLLCERLDPLLAAQQVGLVILLGPCTTFFDENVPFKEAFLLFQRLLEKLTALCAHGPLLLMTQGLDGDRRRRMLFVRELVKVVELGIRVSTVAGRRHVQLVKPRGPG